MAYAYLKRSLISWRSLHELMHSFSALIGAFLNM